MQSFFRDRQILIRSDQGVTHLHIRARHQTMAALVCAGMLVWAIGGTITAATGAATIRSQQVQIAELSVGYAQVIARASNRREALDDGAAALEETITDRVVADNGRLRADLQAAVADRQRLTGRLADLEDLLAARSAEADALQRELADADERSAEARVHAASLNGELQRKRADITRLTALAANRASEIARLDTRLAQSQSWAVALEAEVDDLTDSVNNALETAQSMADDRDRVMREREADRQEFAAIEAARDEFGTLVRALIDGAGQLRRERDTTLTALGTERARGDQLTGIINDLVASQEHVFAELRDRADRQRQELAEGLAQTGLDIDRMIDEVWSEMYPGVGGPFIPVSGISFLDSSVWTRAEVLAESVERTVATHELATRLPVAMPIRDSHRLSSRFGQRRDPFTGRASGHLGLDFAAPRGTAILAPAHGTVVFAGWRGAYGRLVEVDHGFGITTRYAHMTQISVEEGQEVSTGDLVGRVGTTGRSTGPHLHYEIRVDGSARNPEDYLRAGDYVFEITNQD